MANRLLAARLKEAHIIRREPVKLRSGIDSNVYFDIKKAYAQPDLVLMMARLLLESINDKPSTSCVAASGLGGIPLAVIISQECGLPLSLVRDSVKNHGLPNLVVGYLPSQDDEVAVVDDVFSSGSSLLSTITTVEKAGAPVNSCHVILARGDTSNFPYPIAALLTDKDITER